MEYLITVNGSEIAVPDKVKSIDDFKDFASKIKANYPNAIILVFEIRKELILSF